MPVTLSDKKYALNKVYVLNKQVSNYMVLPFFSNNTSIVSIVTFVLVTDLCYYACASCI